MCSWPHTDRQPHQFSEINIKGEDDHTSTLINSILTCNLMYQDINVRPHTRPYFAILWWLDRNVKSSHTLCGPCLQVWKHETRRPGGVSLNRSRKTRSCMLPVHSTQMSGMKPPLGASGLSTVEPTRRRRSVQSKRKHGRAKHPTHPA